MTVAMSRRWARLAALALGVAVAVGPVAVGPAALAAQQENRSDSPAAAQGPRATWQGPRGWAAFVQELGLTDQQLQEIRRIQLQAQEEQLPLRTELFRKRQELNLALRRAEPDEARIRALVQEIGQLRTQLDSARVQTHLRIRSVLTAEQRQKLEGLPWGAWGGHMPGGPWSGRAGMGRGGRMGGGFCPGPGAMGVR